MSRPIIWSVAGNDSGGGAGLSADARAAEACEVHLCPVVASVTAQNSLGVARVVPVAAELLDAQLAALAADLRPAVIKTGLIGSAEGVAVLLRWLARLDAEAQAGRGERVRLVVDPVLGASAGGTGSKAFCDEALLAAYRGHLLPRADLITPNRREAARLLGLPEAATLAEVPAQAAALRALGVGAVAITGGDSADGSDALDWIDTPLAQGWLALPRLDARHTHGTGCTFATSAAAAMARGFVTADALVLAKMATAAAIAAGHAAGQGAGPVRADAAFITQPGLLPALWPGPERPPERLPSDTVGRHTHATGLYVIVNSAERVQAVLAAAAAAPPGVPLPTLQLRIKRPASAAWDDPAWQAQLREELTAALAAAAAAGATLYVNDHWRDALTLGASALHLGQEDLLALQPEDRARLRAAQARGLRLGISSHSLWELARAAAWQPSYVACGPIWPTTTKDMPWRPQGLVNLAWWARMAPAPVVGIGGVLAPEQLQSLAAAGAEGGCVVRGLADPHQTLAIWQAAWQEGRAQRRSDSKAILWPLASLTPGSDQGIPEGHPEPVR